MQTKPVFLTAEGKAKLEADLEYLRTERRREIVERIHASMEFAGDPMDNTEYQDAKNEQAFVEGKILELGRLLANAQIIQPSSALGDAVGLGSTVTVIDDEGVEETFTLVGPAEANPLRGRISNESPVGRSLLGRRLGDRVEVHAPGGTLYYTVVGCENCDQKR